MDERDYKAMNANKRFTELSEKAYPYKMYEDREVTNKKRRAFEKGFEAGKASINKI